MRELEKRFVELYTRTLAQIEHAEKQNEMLLRAVSDKEMLGLLWSIRASLIQFTGIMMRKEEEITAL
jgi:hypothetical protein